MSSIGTQHDIKSIAHAIGHGHAYKKHVEKKNEFADRGLGLEIKIRNRSDLSKHVESVMTDKTTRVFRSAKNKIYFYNFKSNTAVAYDPLHKDRGSCWRAAAGVEEVRRLVLQDYKKQLGEPNLAVKPLRARVHAGGISGLPLEGAAVLDSSFASDTVRDAAPAAPKANRYLVPRHRSTKL